ncbi:MAG: SOS response-associated peptidase [Pirellulaceae bacterium]|nr:SOS response-associated peptidase [Pirellulaceae bacterium]
MCGRFSLHSRLNLLLQQFALEAGPELAPRYNIAPTQSTPVVRVATAQSPRQLVALRWGLVPFWAKEVGIGSRMINARAETLASKPSFRNAFKKRRCLVPTDGYFEWKKAGKTKQPFYIRKTDQTPFAMAGLWESWHTGKEDAVESFTIITTQANDAMASIHDRMPVIVAPDNYEMWIDPEFKGQASLEAILQPYEPEDLTVTPVSTIVNSPRNDDPECVREVVR